MRSMPTCRPSRNSSCRGAPRAAADAHLARAVCRRAERSAGGAGQSRAGRRRFAPLRESPVRSPASCSRAFSIARVAVTTFSGVPPSPRPESLPRCGSAAAHRPLPVLQPHPGLAVDKRQPSGDDARVLINVYRTYIRTSWPVCPLPQHGWLRRSRSRGSLRSSASGRGAQRRYARRNREKHKSPEDEHGGPAGGHAERRLPLTRRPGALRPGATHAVPGAHRCGEVPT